MRLIPFKEDHLDLVEHSLEYTSIEDLKIDVATNPALGDVGFTCIRESIPIFCCGMKRISPTTAHIWITPSIHCKKHAVYFFKTMRKLLEFHAKEFKVRRVQTSIVNEHMKWIEMLGFEKEATLKEFQPDGSDLHLYVKFYR